MGKELVRVHVLLKNLLII